MKCINVAMMGSGVYSHVLLLLQPQAAEELRPAGVVGAEEFPGYLLDAGLACADDAGAQDATVGQQLRLIEVLVVDEKVLITLEEMLLRDDGRFRWQMVESCPRARTCISCSSYGSPLNRASHVAAVIVVVVIVIFAVVVVVAVMIVVVNITVIVVMIITAVAVP